MANQIVVLDTCALIWWTLDRAKLSPSAQTCLQDTNKYKFACSSISIWEIGIKIKRGKLDIGTTIEDYYHRLSRVTQLDILAVDATVWIGNISLDWEHKDPADRTIVATAKLHHAPLMTSDCNIRDFYANTIW